MVSAAHTYLCGAWHVASMAYAASNELSSNGNFMKSPCRAIHEGREERRVEASRKQ